METTDEISAETTIQDAEEVSPASTQEDGQAEREKRTQEILTLSNEDIVTRLFSEAISLATVVGHQCGAMNICGEEVYPKIEIAFRDADVNFDDIMDEIISRMS